MKKTKQKKGAILYLSCCVCLSAVFLLLRSQHCPCLTRVHQYSHL